jgi:alpha-ketoglutarate-dependent taurine dioxygenase
MSVTTLRQPLTESGLGLVLSAPPGTLPAELAPAVRAAALQTGCVLVQNLNLDETGFRQLVHAFGRTVDHKFGEGQADLLRLDASPDAGKVVTGRCPLPLHTDGLLVGERTDLIILYAADFADAPGSGETFVCDQLAAWRRMPHHLRRVLDTHNLEYLVEERGYFPNVPEDWYPIPTTRDYGRVRSLNLALRFPPETRPQGWQVRVAGMRGHDSDEFLAELEAYLLSPQFVYQHRWTVDDLLAIDNQRTLHGRTAIGPGGIRLLFRGQVTLPGTG